MRQRTILDPRIQAIPGPHHFPVLTDYISVDAINTFGTWQVQDMIPLTSVAELARWANAQEKGSR
jgi:hypothetical protein